MVTNNQISVRLPPAYKQYIDNQVEVGEARSRADFVSRVVINYIDEKRSEEVSC